MTLAPDYVSVNKGARLWVDDAPKIMSRWEEPVSVLFADPPFNLGEDYAGDGGKSDKKRWPDYVKFMASWVKYVCPMLKPGGTAFIHVPDHIVSYVHLWLEAAGMVPINWIILHGEFGQYTAGRFICSKVHCLYFAKPPIKKRTWHVVDVLEPSKRLAVYNDPRTQDAKYKGMRPFLDVWYGSLLGRVQGNNAERWRSSPNQLPEMYLARLIRSASNPGDLIFDPFSGSGTTGTVACALGRKFAGVELVPKIAKSGWQRILKGPVRDVAGSLAVGTSLTVKS